MRFSATHVGTLSTLGAFFLLPLTALPMNSSCGALLHGLAPGDVAIKVLESLKRNPKDGVPIEFPIIALAKAELPGGEARISDLLTALKKVEKRSASGLGGDFNRGGTLSTKLESEILQIRGVSHLIYRQSVYWRIAILPGYQTGLNRFAMDAYDAGETIVTKSAGRTRFDLDWNLIGVSQDVFLGTRPFGAAEKAVIASHRRMFDASADVRRWTFGGGAKFLQRQQ